MKQSRKLSLIIYAAMLVFHEEDCAVAGNQTNLEMSVSGCGVVSNGLQFCISLDKAIYRTGDLIIVTMVLKNLGSEPKQFLYNLTNPYVYTVLDLDGHRVPFTKREIEVMREFHPKVGSLMLAILEPGEKITDDGNSVTSRYDLSKPGTYFMTIDRILPRYQKGSDARISSNQLQFQIVDTP